MRILLITQYYAPIKGAAAKRTGKMAQFLTEAGHQVTVLTGFPSYPTGILDQKYKGKLKFQEQIDKINITRVYETTASTQNNSLMRMINWLSFCASASLEIAFNHDYDAVIVSSPSFLSGIPGLIASRNKKTKFYFDIRDLWPDSAIQLGLIGENSFVTKQLKKLERTYYNRATKIFTATPGIKEHLIQEKISTDKIEILLNSVDTNIFKPTNAEQTNHDFICGYVGNHSRVYDLKTVIKAARILKDYSNIKFLFIGEGEDKQKLIELAKDLPNVKFENEKKLNELAPIINSFNLGLAPIANIGVSQESFPSKISEYFALAKPVAASLAGDMAKIIEESEAGYIYHPEDAQALAKIILNLSNNSDLTQKIGQNALKLAQTKFSDQVAKEILIKNIT